MLHLQYKDCKEIYFVMKDKFINGKATATEIKVFNKIVSYLNSIDDACCRSRLTEE